MKLDPIAREAVTAAIEEAHRHAEHPRAIAALVVGAVRDMEPSGLPWVADYIDDLALVGAMKLCSDWRRSHQTEGRTKKGTPVPVPTFSGATTPEGDPVQLRFVGLTADDLRAKKRRMSSQRNSLSSEIQLLNDLIAIMEADESIATAGDALDVLMGRAA
jgi:hypothetical protein